MPAERCVLMADDRNQAAEAARAASVVADAKLRRTRMAAALSATRRQFALEARQGRGGRAAQNRYAGEMDAVVAHLVEAGRVHTLAPLVVCALGGYGRRTLCLHSDIDLMILFGTALGREEERFVNAVLQPLWDLQLVVGHQVRELSDFDELDTTNTEFLLAVLDARPIAGDLELFERLTARVSQVTADDRTRAVDPLLELIEQRHAQFNGTIYQLEPDIKNAPGGLRDIAAMRYLQTLGGERGDGERSRAVTTVREAEDFILQVRGVLHAEAGRDANILTHELQERVADAIGCEGATARQRVEALMGSYFKHARAIARELGRVQRAARPAADRSQATRVGRHFEIAADGIRFLDSEAAGRRCGSRFSASPSPTAVQCPNRRSTASSRTCIASLPTISPAPKRSASSCGHCSIRVPASTRACRKCTIAGC